MSGPVSNLENPLTTLNDRRSAYMTHRLQTSSCSFW